MVGEQQKTTDNVFVGGRNRWPYESFINWEFWWPGFPVLVYFKVGFTGYLRTGAWHVHLVMDFGTDMWRCIVAWPWCPAEGRTQAALYYLPPWHSFVNDSMKNRMKKAWPEGS